MGFNTVYLYKPMVMGAARILLLCLLLILKGEKSELTEESENLLLRVLSYEDKMQREKGEQVFLNPK